jgi:hypothetical protein
MICGTCGAVTTRIRILAGHERCHSCAGFSEAGGIRLDGVLSRQRVRMDSAMNEGDVITPTVWDKALHKEIPNEEFIRRHSANAHNFLSADQVAKSHPKLAKKILAKELPQELATGIGDSTREVEKVIKQLQPIA